MKTLDDLKKVVNNARENPDHSYTYWCPLGYDPETHNLYAVVFGWVGEYEDGKDHLCGKVAYLSHNSIMAEYSIDWLLPESDIDDYIVDTEIEICDDTDLTWLLAEAKVWFNAKHLKETA